MGFLRRLHCIAIALTASTAPARAAITERVNIDSNGAQANDETFTASISGDGRFVAFATGANNLVPDDTSIWNDVFVHDRQTEVTERVTVDSSGVEANGQSSHTSISADGRFVTFRSSASNLVADDTNGTEDIFVHDRVMHTTERVSVNSSGAGGGSVTGWGLISDDGRVVAFLSLASDLVPDDTNGAWDVFVRDRQTGTTSRVTVDSAGVEANWVTDSIALSGDGQVVAFSSRATNLVAGDTNGAPDVFVHDRANGVTTRVNLDPSGNQVVAFDVGAPVAVSGDGRLVAFLSSSSALVAGDSNGNTDIFVHDRQTGSTTLASVDSFGNQSSFFVGTGFSLSANGRFVAFASPGTFVDGDTNGAMDVFLRDRQTGVTTRVSVDSGGNEADTDSFGAQGISADGAAVLFESIATNLVADDTNGFTDIFVHDQEIADPDSDGVPDELEDGAPNDGDGNGDGTPDSEQANVTSLPNAVDEEFVTLVAPAGTTLADVVAVDPGTLPPPPAGPESLPIGVLSFEVQGMSPGAAVTVEILVPAGTTITSYYKYGPETADPLDHWYEFLYDGTTGAVIGPDRVTLHLVDGGRGDADLAADGAIVDPGAPVFAQGAYAFTGFLQPVDNPPVVNRLKAGSAVPVKFSLGGSFGLEIVEDGYPRSQAVACESGAPLDDIEQTTTAGGSGLRYDSVSGEYTYTWKTEKAWAGTCRRFELELDDGSAARVADFRFVE